MSFVSILAFLASAWRLAKIFWSAVLIGLTALAAAHQGNYNEALAILVGALGLGQVIHQSNKTTVASELARLAAGAAKANVDALKKFLETLGETVKPPVIFDGPPTIAFERVTSNVPPPDFYMPKPKGPSGPRGEDLRGDGQAQISSVQRDRT